MTKIAGFTIWGDIDAPDTTACITIIDNNGDTHTCRCEVDAMMRLMVWCAAEKSHLVSPESCRTLNTHARMQ